MYMCMKEIFRTIPTGHLTGGEFCHVRNCLRVDLCVRVRASQKAPGKASVPTSEAERLPYPQEVYPLRRPPFALSPAGLSQAT